MGKSDDDGGGTKRTFACGNGKSNELEFIAKPSAGYGNGNT